MHFIPNYNKFCCDWIHLENLLVYCSSRVATLSTLQSEMTVSSDEEEGQAFYAGGSVHSGQQVLGPGKKKDFVAEMFKSVQK